MLGAKTTAFKSVRFDEGALEARGCDVETLDLTQVFDKIKAISDDDARIAAWREDICKLSDTCDAPEYAIINQAKLAIALEEALNQ